MGAYIYSALGPKHARLVEIERPDGSVFQTTVYVLVYTYKPSWISDSLQRDLGKRFNPVIERRERAWDEFVVPQHAVVVSTLNDKLDRVRPKIEPGNQVLMWEKHDRRWNGEGAQCPLGDPYNYSARREDCVCTPEVLPGKLCVRDDPNWSNATGVGTVKRIVGMGEVKRREA